MVPVIRPAQGAALGSKSNSPINEASNFLSQSNPPLLASLRSTLPEISDELQPGIMAGEEELNSVQQRKVVLAKGRMMLAALGEARTLCDRALPWLLQKCHMEVR